MAKKRLDTDEVKIRWHQFINDVEADPALQSFFQHHPGVGEEPRTLFDAVGEDLANSRDEIREQAFWILVAGMPELADILHERESRRPGWRSGVGQGQQEIDRGMDIVTNLYRNLVKEHRFKTDKGKDPRPYVRRTARNWNIDAVKKDSRTVLSLDEPLSDEGITLGSSLASSLPDLTSVEDEVVNELYYEYNLQQIRTWNFLIVKEIPLFDETFAAKKPLNWLAEQFDTPAQEAARKRQQQKISKRISRARKKVSVRLEVEFIKYLIWFGHLWNCKEGLPKEVDKFLSDWWLWKWADCAISQCLQKRRLHQDALFWGSELLLLTERFDGSPGKIYLFSHPSDFHDNGPVQILGLQRPHLFAHFFLDEQIGYMRGRPEYFQGSPCGKHPYGIASLDKHIRKARAADLDCSLIVDLGPPIIPLSHRFLGIQKPTSHIKKHGA
jgi:hypothetical protein